MWRNDHEYYRADQPRHIVREKNDYVDHDNITHNDDGTNEYKNITTNKL